MEEHVQRSPLCVDSSQEKAQSKREPSERHFTEGNKSPEHATTSSLRNNASRNSQYSQIPHSRIAKGNRRVWLELRAAHLDKYVVEAHVHATYTTYVLKAGQVTTIS